jgi:hypothetical protein
MGKTKLGLVISTVSSRTAIMTDDCHMCNVTSKYPVDTYGNKISDGSEISETVYKFDDQPLTKYSMSGNGYKENMNFDYKHVGKSLTDITFLGVNSLK